MAAQISITINSSASGSAIADTKKEIASIGETAEKAGSGFSLMGEVATGFLREIGAAAFNVAAGGLKAMAGAIADGITDAREAAKTMAQTQAVITSTGGAAGVTAQQVADYAASLSAAAGASLFGDDQIQQSTNLLLTFSEIKGSALQAATAISVDMAQALGGAPKDAAIQLGKALNDPIKGVTALTRVGVTFTAEQKAQIKTLQESGDMLGAQKVILGELNKEFGGSAAAAAQADGGWAQFNDRMGEAKESIGTAILPLLGRLAGILNDTVAPAIEGLATWFGERLPGAIDSLSGTISPFIDRIGSIATAFQTGGISAALPLVQADLATLRDNLLGWVTTSLPGWIASLAGFVGPTAKWILDAIPGLLTNLANTRERMFSWITESLPGWLTSLGKFVAPAAQWILDAIPGLLDNLGTFAQRMIDQTLTYVPKWAATLLQFGIKAISWVADAGPGLVDNLGEFLNRMARWVVDSLPKWGAELAKLGGKAVQWVKDALPDLGTNLGEMAGKLIAWILETAIDVVPKLAVLGGKFLLWVATDVIPALPGVLASIGTGIFNFIVALTGELGPKIAEMARKFTSWVQDEVMPKLPGVLDNIKTGIGGWVEGAVNWAGDKLTGVGRAIVDGLKQGISDAWGRLLDWFNHKLDELRDMLPFSEPKDLNSPLRNLSQSGFAIGQMIQSGIDSFGPLHINSLAAPLVVQAADYAGGAGSSVGGGRNATYNQQRSINATFNYHNVANPLSTDSAILQSLASV